MNETKTLAERIASTEPFQRGFTVKGEPAFFYVQTAEKDAGRCVLTFNLESELRANSFTSVWDLMVHLYRQLVPGPMPSVISTDEVEAEVNGVLATLNKPVLVITGWQHLDDPIGSFKFAINWLKKVECLQTVCFVGAKELRSELFNDDSELFLRLNRA